MKTAYLDAFSGVSGDMLVGALLDAGLEFEALSGAIAALALSGYRLSTQRKSASGISAVKFDVQVTEPQPERKLGEIRALIEAAGLSETVKRNSVAVFTALAEAEAKVHHCAPEEVHFHEVGAVDSIIDVVGAVFGLEQLGVARLFVSALPMGAGSVPSRHGVIPVPAPATVELLSGFTVRMAEGEAEMVTPTGAAVLARLAAPAPEGLALEIERVGYGAGLRQGKGRPNLLRLILGRERLGFEGDEVLEISADMDDLNPQIYDYVRERLLVSGARDVTVTPTIMKKGRPGARLMVLAEPASLDRVAEILFAETSTIGLRFHRVARLKLGRRIVEAATRFGPIRVKVAGADGAALTVAPEYEDCRLAARKYGVALKLVIEEARAAARRQLT